MSYVVKEIVYTLQGEGAQAGRAAVFCRFAGCNLWTGHEADRADATCSFCDTDFVGTDGPGGGRFESAADLAKAIVDCRSWIVNRETAHDRPSTIHDSHPDTVRAPWPAIQPLVVFTGGEPALQLDPPLIDALRTRGFEIAIETNGTLELPRGIDWVCVSPKAGTALRVTRGDELKLIYPQPGAEPEQYERLAFGHFFIQPMDGPERQANTKAAVAYCLRHPRWRISLQTHKILGIP